MGTQLEGDCVEPIVNIAETLTQVGTEGQLPSSNWYNTAVGTSWNQGRGVSASSMSQFDHSRSIPHNVQCSL